MALLKVFVSSTCYDFNILRTQLRASIQSIGHEPVMSDYYDVLFDPRSHTHESCVQEIANADVVILIIGSRFGGTAIPEAVKALDLDNLKTLSRGTKLLETPNKISITQLEILKAVESTIPIFTFIDSKVAHEHLFYEKNKDKGILDKLHFPSIDKPESAVYIFEFINYIRLRSKNNNILEFNKLSDIEDYLKKQWSSYFQRLLLEQRIEQADNRRLIGFSEELKDIKSLILSSITTTQAKDVGKGVLKYRRMIEFFNGFTHSDMVSLLSENISWDDLLKTLEIKEVRVLQNPRRYKANDIYFIKTDGTYYSTRLPDTTITRFSNLWPSFIQLNSAIKISVIEAVIENIDPNAGVSIPDVSYHNRAFEEYLKEREERMSGGTIIAFDEVSLADMANLEKKSAEIKIQFNEKN